MHYPKTWIHAPRALIKFNSVFGCDEYGRLIKVIDITCFNFCMVFERSGAMQFKAQIFQHVEKPLWLPNPCHCLTWVRVKVLPMFDSEFFLARHLFKFGWL